ncbi:MAG: S-layer protein, partial [Nanoarchaeota archaeon]|nr:S-layer protein [Nanoarchaeota archaeon]
MQRLKRAIKRIAAVGAGMAMLGATMTGALAQPDLADYPAPFIVDGKGAGNIAIVVGAVAASADTLGAIDVAKQLQFDSKVCTPDTGSTGTVSVSGDAVEISRANDMLELREAIGDVRETLTDVEVAGGGLAGGRITTDEGSTDFNQYLRFKDSSNPIQGGLKVNFTESEGIFDGQVGDYLHVAEGSSPTNQSTAFFEYELEFESGLESAVTSGTLPDLEDEEVLILGTTYSIVDTSVDTANDEIKLTLFGGAVYDILGEGETKTYNIDGKDYEVTVMIIEDVTPSTVTFEINGEITKQLGDSETTTLNDGLLIAVSDIVLNEAGEAGSGDLVELYIGASKLVIEDVEYIDSLFDQKVEIDNEDITNALVSISASELSSGDKLEISSIKYRLSASSLNGIDLWVEPGHGVREYLDEPQGMLGVDWDIRYEGLDDVQTSIVKLDPKGSDEYSLIFENRQGLVFNVPYVTNEGGTFKYGSDNRDLVYREGNYSSTGNATHNIPTVGHLDYFVLSDQDTADGLDNGAITHVMRYDSYDASDNTLKFKNMAAGDTKEVSFAKWTTLDGNGNGTIGSGDLVLGGTTYKVYVSNVTTGNPPLIIDLDGDGTATQEEVRVTINGGGILDLGNHLNASGGTWSGEDNDYNGTWDNDGQLITTTEGGVNFTLTTLVEDYDETGPTSQGTTQTPENVTILIENRSSNQIGILTSSTTTNGGLWKLLEDDDNDDYYYGMTDYGALFTLYDPSSSNNAEVLTIEYPLAQRGARV